MSHISPKRAGATPILCFVLGVNMMISISVHNYTLKKVHSALKSKLLSGVALAVTIPTTQVCSIYMYL